MAPKLARILIALDNGSSSAALEHGLALAAEDDAEVVLTHVVPIAGERLVPHDRRADRVGDHILTRVLVDAAAKADAAGVRARTELLIGYPPREIAALADDFDSDLVIVGSRPAGAMRKLLLGSTSRALLSETERPVLVVPQQRA